MHVSAAEHAARTPEKSGARGGRGGGERQGQGHKANIIRKDKDEEQTEQPSLALNKYILKIQKPH